jgi:hypothetical protein
VTITYHYKIVGGLEETQPDTVNTDGTGKYSDSVGPPPGKGTATATWPGNATYAGATSTTCEYEH